MSRIAWNKKMTDLDEQNIIKWYIKDNLTTKEILNKLNKFKTSKTITDILHKYNIPIKEKWEFIDINHSAFDKIETEAQAYFLGLLTADGWVQEKTNGIGIQLIHTDIDILKDLALFLHIEISKIKTYYPSDSIIKGKILHRSPAARLVWHSPWMKKHLAKYGVINKKSKREWLPYLNEKLMRHYLRGFLDGDGTICATNIGTTHIKFIGSKTMCDQIKQFLYYKLNISIPKTSAGIGIHGVTWAKQHEIEILIPYLWKDISHCLNRKNPYEN